MDYPASCGIVVGVTRARQWKWSVLVAGVLVVAACATQRFTGAFSPPPHIRGTDIPVPRAWAARGSVRDWKWIVVHHSASDSGGALVFDEWHRKRGWDELGYHFVIDNGEGQPDGRVEVGSRWYKQKQGAHAKSKSGEYNERGIGICLVGNFEKDRPTDEQWNSLVRLVAYLSREFDIPEDRIIGHRDVNDGTLCPGEHLSIDKLREDVAVY